MNRTLSDSRICHDGLIIPAFRESRRTKVAYIVVTMHRLSLSIDQRGHDSPPERVSVDHFIDTQHQLFASLFTDL
jgi:hypothetical protein